MAERLTLQKMIEYARQKAKDNKNEFYTFGIQKCKQCAEEHEQLAEWLEDLQHYKDLEEQGRMVILPDGMNLRKLLEILDGNNSSCPSEYNLINRCELSCFECWLAALKGAEDDTERND